MDTHVFPRRGVLPKYNTVEQDSMLGAHFRQMVRDSVCFLWPMASIAEEIDGGLQKVAEIDEDSFDG